MIGRTIAPALLSVTIIFSLVSCDGEKNTPEGRAQHTEILPSTQVHEGWYFAAGDVVSIEGTVNGDVYAAGGRVDVSGTVNGDLLVAGGQVTITGVVSDDIRVGGGIVRIDGQVGKNVTAAGGTIVIGRPGVVKGGVIAAGGDMQSSGQIQGNAMVFSGSSEITGMVGGDLTFAGGQLTLLPGANIAGNLTARAEKDQVHIGDGTVRGTVKIVAPEEKETMGIAGGPGFGVFLRILWAACLLVTGAVFFALFRGIFVRYATMVRNRSVTSLLWGFASILLLPVLMIILAVTVVGFPLALLLFDVYFWFAFLSQLSLALLTGELIFRNMQGGGWAPFWSFLVGLLIVQALTFIPYLGGLIIVVGFVWGFGALVLLVGDAWTARRAAASHD